MANFWGNTKNIKSFSGYMAQWKDANQMYASGKFLKILHYVYFSKDNFGGGTRSQCDEPALECRCL